MINKIEPLEFKALDDAKDDDGEMIQNSKKYEYIKDSRCANIITGGNFENAHFAEKYQGFDLARGRYEVNPFTQERRYF